MRRLLLMASALVAVSAVVACSAKDSASPTDTGTPPVEGTYTAQIFVEDVAQGWCGAVRSCDADTWEGTHGGDQSTCLAAERYRWEAALTAMECELDVDAAVACVNGLATTTCEDWSSGATPARCEAVTACP